MRTAIPILLVLSACDGWEGTRTGTQTDNGCLGATEVMAADAGMTVTSLLFDGQTYVAVFAETTYDDRGYSACFNPDTGTARWVFEANNEPLGALTMNVDQTGNIDMQGDGASFVIDFYESGVRFSNLDFVTGQWVVDAITPTIDTTILGDARVGSDFLTINLAAEMTP